MRLPWVLDVDALPPAGKFAPSRGSSRVPSIQRTVIVAWFINLVTGQRQRAKYLHTIDRSRYPPHMLRELRRTRR